MKGTSTQTIIIIIIIIIIFYLVLFFPSARTCTLLIIAMDITFACESKYLALSLFFFHRHLFSIFYNWSKENFEIILCSERLRKHRTLLAGTLKIFCNGNCINLIIKKGFTRLTPISVLIS